ncbi:MAG: (Fe-S)-binding protein [Candidatus Eisenbacteria bacterium]|nr:(Fe-S)-binding protein [Candidatus Eisenbacteria bacterium]
MAGEPTTHTDEIEARLAAMTPEDFRRGMEIFRSKLRESEVDYLKSCVRCGLCAESCHYFLSDGEADSIPASKLDVVASAFQRHFTIAGRIAPGLSGARRFDRALARRWVDAVFGRCSLCGRCSLQCTMGIHIPSVLRAARGTLTELGLIPSDLLATVQASLDKGNNMGIERQDWIETIEWLEEELQTATGDPNARIPIDRHGARYLFTVNPREPKFFPLTLLASATVLHAAKEDWTVASEGWDLTNYGLFSGSAAQGGPISAQMLASMDRLGCGTLLMGECGHGFAAARWEAPEWLQRTPAFPIRSFLEVMEEYLRDGRIRVDPSRNPEPVTLHDPCNLVRHGGVFEPQREILRRSVARFVEMTPNRAENYCCGGGGGQLSMGRYKERRLRAGGIKAEQIRRTGAKIVVAPCHNCIDQLMELNKEYELGVSIQTVAEVVSNALVFESPVAG